MLHHVPENEPGLRLVHAEGSPPRAQLVEPRPTGFIYLAGTVAPSPLPFVLPNARRRKLLAEVKDLARALAQMDRVQQVRVFRAIVRPPTARFSRYLKQRAGTLHPADYDVMVLVEAESPEAARAIRHAPACRAIEEALTRSAQSTFVMVARNAKRIADVDATRPGLYLFNHFAADEPATMLVLWDYLAGWYVAETGLRNSEALVPLPGERTDYAVVNWARWDSSPLVHFWSQLSKRSFWRYVTGNLEANHAASMPIYCRLA